MPILVPIHKAKSDLSRLVVQALAGEEVIITRSGEPVVRLVPLWGERVPGLAQGKVQISPNFEAPLPAETLRNFESE